MRARAACARRTKSIPITRRTASGKKRGVVVRLRKLLPKWSRGVRATLKLAALKLICEHATRRVQNKLQKVDYISEKEETRRTSFRIYQRARTDLLAHAGKISVLVVSQFSFSCKIYGIAYFIIHLK